jgi:hypothetical protein
MTVCPWIVFGVSAVASLFWIVQRRQGPNPREQSSHNLVQHAAGFLGIRNYVDSFSEVARCALESLSQLSQFGPRAICTSTANPRIIVEQAVDVVVEAVSGGLNKIGISSKCVVVGKSIGDPI